MKDYNQVEILLFSKYAPRDVRQKELIRWLGTAAQHSIYRQNEKVHKYFLKLLKNTPAIYMS